MKREEYIRLRKSNLILEIVYNYYVEESNKRGKKPVDFIYFSQVFPVYTALNDISTESIIEELNMRYSVKILYKNGVVIDIL